MNISDLGFSDNVVRFFKKQKCESLYPYQKKAIEEILLNDKNILISAPTGNGKTLIAMLSVINHLKNVNSKIIYLVPSRVLASQKYEEFLKLEQIKINGKKPKIVMRIGGNKLSICDKKNIDVIIMTNEMLYSTLQQEPSWINKITLLIIDELYLINQECRGPKLEILATLCKLKDNIRIIALSPVIDNVDEIASWLDATYIKTTDQITKVKKLIYRDKKIITKEGDFVRKVIERSTHPFINISIEQIKKQKQVLLFTTRKADGENHTSLIYKKIKPYIDSKKLRELKKASNEILDYNENTKKICEIAEYIKNGSAFHNADLSDHCLRVIEREVKSKNIMFLSCSKTLTEGVNFPIYLVIIANTKTDKEHSDKLTYQQICGRAGRSEYNKDGESIIIDDGSKKGLENYNADSIGKLETQLKNNWKNYIMDIIRFIPECNENKISKLLCNTIDGEYFEDTSIVKYFQSHVKELEKYDMVIKKNMNYTLTKFGTIPFSSLSPKIISEICDKLKSFSNNRSHYIELLYLISRQIHYDIAYMNNTDIVEKILDEQNNDLQLTESMIDSKMIILYMLISEIPFDAISYENYDIKSIQNKAIKIFDEIKNLALYIKRNDLYHEIKDLKKCIKHIIRPELLDLIQLDGIGGVRARSLYNNGITNLEDVSDKSVKSLSKIDKISLKMAKKMKDELRKGIRIN